VTLRKSLILASAAVLTCFLFGLFSVPCFGQKEASSAQLDSIALISEANTADSLGLSADPIALNAASESPEPGTASDALPASYPGPQKGTVGSSPRVGVGVTSGLFGIGGEVAVRVLPSANVRFGFTGLGISHSFSRDQITYGARLRLEAAQLTFDYFFHFIHLSPGLLLYNGTKITGTASALAGNTITLNHVDYLMSSPLTGSLDVTFRKTAPVVMFGFGNLVPRKGRHWSITSDFGVAFSGSPNAALNLAGTACPVNPPGPCADIATTPAIESNVIAEQSSVNDKLKFFKIYPVISVGFGWAF
jgi:hypothetical protein